MLCVEKWDCDIESYGFKWIRLRLSGEANMERLNLEHGLALCSNVSGVLLPSCGSINFVRMGGCSPSLPFQDFVI